MGTVVFLGIKTVMTPPAVSIPKLKGATSITKRSLTYSLPDPVRIAA